LTIQPPVSAGLDPAEPGAAPSLSRRLLDRLPRGPQRTLVSALAADSVGQGLLLSMTTFYFLQIVQLSPKQVGAGLSVAALCALLSSTPAGYLADHWNARALSRLLAALQSVPIVAYIFIQNFTGYVVASSAYAVLYASTAVAVGAVMPSVIPASERVKTRAMMRVTSNVGVSVGALIGGLALSTGSALVYQVLFVLAAAGVVFSGYLFGTLKPVAQPEAATPATSAASAASATPHAPEPKVAVFRDAPYILITLLCAILAANDTLLIVALPMWISSATSVSPSIFSAILLLNTALVVSLQIRISKGSESPTGAARAVMWSGRALLVSCVLWALAGQVSTPVAIVLLLFGGAVHTFGELWWAAGGWGLSYGLAPENAHGRYQGVFSTGAQLTRVLVPLIAGAALVSAGLWGWTVTGVMLLVAGAFGPWATRWALRTRQLSADSH